ncbi:hypothetical protein [Streptomyces sp. NPDC007991]
MAGAFQLGCALGGASTDAVTAPGEVDQMLSLSAALAPSRVVALVGAAV